MDLTSIWSLVANGTFIAAAAIPTIAVAWHSWGTTQPNQKTIIDSFGDIKRVVDPGLFLKLPWQTATSVQVNSQIESEPLNVVTKDTNGTKLPVKNFLAC